jgi:hypothetical protein
LNPCKSVFIRVQLWFLISGNLRLSAAKTEKEEG